MLPRYLSFLFFFLIIKFITFLIPIVIRIISASAGVNGKAQKASQALE